MFECKLINRCNCLYCLLKFWGNVNYIFVLQKKLPQCPVSCLLSGFFMLLLLLLGMMWPLMDLITVVYLSGLQPLLLMSILTDSEGL